jgi:hypothetical protein
MSSKYQTLQLMFLYRPVYHEMLYKVYIYIYMLQPTRRQQSSLRIRLMAACVYAYTEKRGDLIS